MPLRLPLLTVLALFLSCLAAFFLVFVTVFADGSMNERLITAVMDGVVYLLLGGLFGWLVPGRRMWWTGWIAGPAVLLLLWYSTHEPSQIVFLAFMAVLVTGAAALGSGLRKA